MFEDVVKSAFYGKLDVMKNTDVYIACLFLLFGFSSIYAQQTETLPAFPGAEGFGAHSVGGRGGRVIEVTNLNDDGPGSLREAIEVNEPRIVVFRVSGYIELESNLTIRNPYITIAGQTAPGDGICLKNYMLGVSADHVIVRYLRVRPGDNEEVEVDGLWVSRGRNIIIDHCSVSWGVDETLSVASDDVDLGNVTIQWCMITESLNCAIHSKGCHGYGSLVRGGWGNGYTFHHNLYAHHRGRSPRPGNYNNHNIDPNGLIFDFRNNVVYNWSGSYAGYNADVDSVTGMNFIGNYYIQGPDSSGNYAFREQCPYSKAYFSDNWMDGNRPRDPWSLVRFDGFSQTWIAAYELLEPIIVPPVGTDDGLTAYELVLADAGTTFPQRDAVDVRVVDDVINGTGGIIDDEDEVGGWPELESDSPPVDTDHDGMSDDWERVCCLDPYDSSDASGDRDGDGYTNIEEYINWIPLGEPLPAEPDLNCDEIVNLYDLALFAEYYSCSRNSLSYDRRYDFNNNGRILFDDLLFITRDWLCLKQN